MINLSYKETCPRCHRLVNMLSEIEAHPSRRDLALQNFTCPECGPVRTRIISIDSKADKEQS
jgi:C4-type Zn-finger protein